MATIVDTVEKLLGRLSSLRTNPHQNLSSESCHEQDSVHHPEVVLGRPRSLFRRKEEQDAVFLLLWHNYKFYINLGESHRAMQLFTSILDTGVSSSFIHIDFIPPQVCKKVKTLTQDLKVREDRGKRLQITGTIRLAISVGWKRTFVNFHVAEKSATSVIFACEFCDPHV